MLEYHGKIRKYTSLYHNAAAVMSFFHPAPGDLLAISIETVEFFHEKSNRSVIVDKTICVTYTFKVNKNDGEFLTNM